MCYDLDDSWSNVVHAHYVWFEVATIMILFDNWNAVGLEAVLKILVYSSSQKLAFLLLSGQELPTGRDCLTHM